MSSEEDSGGCLAAFRVGSRPPFPRPDCASKMKVAGRIYRLYLWKKLPYDRVADGWDVVVDGNILSKRLIMAKVEVRLLYDTLNTSGYPNKNIGLLPQLCLKNTTPTHTIGQERGCWSPPFGVPCGAVRQGLWGGRALRPASLVRKSSAKGFFYLHTLQNKQDQMLEQGCGRIRRRVGAPLGGLGGWDCKGHPLLCSKRHASGRFRPSTAPSRLRQLREMTRSGWLVASRFGAGESRTKRHTTRTETKHAPGGPSPSLSLLAFV